MDYKDLPKHLPAVKVTLDTGHIGTYAQRNGGKYAKAAVEFFKLVLKDDHKAKAAFGEKSASVLAKDGWEVDSKNWK